MFSAQFSWATPLNSELNPLFEMGIIMGGGYLPDYPGADQSRVRTLAFPTFFYRGKKFRRDRDEGTRARLFGDSKFNLDLSFSGSFPTNATENDARSGMDDLDWLAEIGPRISWVSDKLMDKFEIRLRFPIRAVIRTDFKFTQAIGVNINPGISVRIFDCFSNQNLCFVSLSSDFVSSGVADYFYGVDPKFATPTRPAYNGESGYLKTGLFLGIGRRVDREFSYFIGGSISSLHDNQNEESPLIKANTNYAAFFGISWYFYQSKEKEELLDGQTTPTSNF